MSTGPSQSLMQFIIQAPFYIACLIGFILALVYWNRVPGPARMTCAAVVLLVVVSIGQTWAQQYVVQNRVANGSSAMQISQTLSMIALIAGFIRAGAIGMLIAAVFMGRAQAAEQRGFNVMPTGPVPPPLQTPPTWPRA